MKWLAASYYLNEQERWFLAGFVVTREFESLLEPCDYIWPDWAGKHPACVCVCVCSASGWLCNVLERKGEDGEVVFMCGCSSSRCVAKRSSFVFIAGPFVRFVLEATGRKANRQCGCCVRCLTQKHKFTLTHFNKTNKQTNKKQLYHREFVVFAKGHSASRGASYTQ